MKKISMKPKPVASDKSADEWVTQNAPEPELDKTKQSAETGRVGVGRNARNASGAEEVSNAIQANGAVLKRLTIDIPEDLHARIKMQCASRRRKMADEIRLILQEHFN